MSNPTGKIDFHLHSYASNVTDYYAANAFAIPESYSDPLALHRLLVRRGMSLVTLTDHNSIDGISHLFLVPGGLVDPFMPAPNQPDLFAGLVNARGHRSIPHAAQVRMFILREAGRDD